MLGKDLSTTQKIPAMPVPTSCKARAAIVSLILISRRDVYLLELSRGWDRIALRRYKAAQVKPASLFSILTLISFRLRRIIMRELRG